MATDVPLEPLKVFKELSNKIAATKTHFEDYSAAVSKLLKLKDELLHKAVTRKPLSTQQLTSITVISSSLFLSKAAIEEQLASVNALAGSSVEQAEGLPTRALLHWMLMAIKLLKRSRISEHLQIRYRTARMLEIWDLAASSIPASPVPTPRTSILKANKKSFKQAAAASAPQAPSPPPLARPSSAGKAHLGESFSKSALDQGPAAATAASSGGGGSGGGGSQSARFGAASPGGPGRKLDLTGGASASGGSQQPALAFPTLPSFVATDASTAGPAAASAAFQQQAASQNQPSSTASLPQRDKPPSVRQRDAPLLEINPAQLSRSGSRIIASPRDIQDSAVASRASASRAAIEAAPNAQAVDDVGLRSVPSGGPIATGSSMPASTSWFQPTAALSSIKPQGSGTNDLLAAVNAVVGGLSLRNTASISSTAALAPIAEQAETVSGVEASASASTPRQQQQEIVAAAAGVAAPDMFLGMLGAGTRQTRSGLRTGSLTAAMAADLARAPSLANNVASQLSRQTSRGMQQPATNQLMTGLSGGVAATDEVDWRS